MKRFHLVRAVDVSGVSGTGVVAEGVQFPNGKVAIQWDVNGLPSSVAVWDSVDDMLEVHGHDGTTWVQWVKWEASHA